MSNLKQLAKRSRTIHSGVKMAKLAPEVPAAIPGDLRRAHDIFRVLPNTMLTLPALVNVYECVRTVDQEEIPGAIAECGVWAGGAIGLMALANRRYGRPRQLHLFDSFEGLPQPAEQDLDIVDGFRIEHPELAPDDGTGELVAIGACAVAAYGDNPLADADDLLDRVLEIPAEQYTIHQGWFQDTVAAADAGPLAILRLDGDWYESTRTCLEGLFDYISPGGFLILDDYGFFAGCSQAVDEFLDGRAIPRSDLHVEHWGAWLRRK